MLRGRLRATLLRLNEWLNDAQADRVIFELENINAIGMARNHVVHEYLTYGMPLTADGPQGRDSRTVRFFDFDHPESGLNEFVVATQFRVRRGNERDGPEDDERLVIPDLVIFVNGIPLVVMEAKSPSLLDVWKSQAVRQLRRYQEAGPEWQGRGAPELFHYNLLCVAHCGASAAYSTLGAPENAYFEWKWGLIPRTKCGRSLRLNPWGRHSSSSGCCPRPLCWTSCGTTWSTNRNGGGWSRNCLVTN